MSRNREDLVGGIGIGIIKRGQGVEVGVGAGAGVGAKIGGDVGLHLARGKGTTVDVAEEGLEVVVPVELMKTSK